ncbi:hypothetical protein [Geothrix edaphica]|uniref:Uncharacterized protein n=1 Tax=Geothrix edaphica TaxID=2927976 RepID=A0ABQ5PV78_9BACT|nr:hypothetical protein [Geothrix edaphica]GLH66258.1 hypothetical protein GETHED_06220 [Geothrix edaphica]
MDHRLEMTLSREEFLRLLPGAVGPFTEEDGGFRGTDGPLRWRIRLIPLPELRVGRVVLPRYQVEIRLEGHTAGQAEAFLARFQRGFQRGGG